MQRKRQSNIFYKPKIWLIGLDALIISLSITFVFLFLPLTTSNPFRKYAVSILIFVSVWMLLSYFFKRYVKLRSRSFFKQVFALFYVSILVFALFGAFILIQPRSPYSENVLLTVLIGVFTLEYLALFIYFAYKYATQYDIPKLHYEQREKAVAYPAYTISKDAVKERRERILENIGEKGLCFIQKNTEWNSSGTLILNDLRIHEFTKINFYEYSTIVQMKRLNNIRGINKMFAIANERLPDDGVLVCRYKSQSTTKGDVFKRYPKVVAYIYYTGHFLIHRILPKFFLTKRLYYDLTEGKKRILSKTEVLGRLTYCGFSIEKESKIDTLNYVIARRKNNAMIQGQRNYGVLIKLKRIGKNNKLFSVYKFRTMHPYAEFLQDYVFQKGHLAEGGKFKNDIRVTTIGGIMRRFWLDELPMLYNLLKRDMKLVGVRPLSQQYFNLYSEELQQKRVKHKPGLLPPFYAHMPKTLEEIQASEMKYLTECEKNGTLRTDTKYFFLILKNILFHKARSA